MDVNYFGFLAHVSVLPIWFLLLAGSSEAARPPAAAVGPDLQLGGRALHADPVALRRLGRHRGDHADRRPADDHVQGDAKGTRWSGADWLPRSSRRTWSSRRSGGRGDCRRGRRPPPPATSSSASSPASATASLPSRSARCTSSSRAAESAAGCPSWIGRPDRASRPLLARARLAARAPLISPRRSIAGDDAVAGLRMVTAQGRQSQTDVLVTGGAGFIGSHTCVELLEHGYEVVVVDDHSNSSPRALERVAKVAGRPLSACTRSTSATGARWRRSSRRTRSTPCALRGEEGGRGVGADPVEYYDTNVGGSTALLRAMAEHDVRRLVFSSSCSIYGDADRAADRRAGAAATDQPVRGVEVDLRAGARRCVLGAARSSRDRAALLQPGRRAPQRVARRGSARRAEQRDAVSGAGRGRPAGAAERLRRRLSDRRTAPPSATTSTSWTSPRHTGSRWSGWPGRPGARSLNLGTGVGTSVLELVSSVRRGQRAIDPVPNSGRRDGDVAALVADPSEAARVWGWRTTRDIDAMCRDAWRFQELNPAGYD